MFYKVTDKTNGIESIVPIFYCTRRSVNVTFCVNIKVDLGSTGQLFVIFSCLCLKTFPNLRAKALAKFYLKVTFSIMIPHRC